MARQPTEYPSAGFLFILGEESTFTAEKSDTPRPHHRQPQTTEESLGFKQAPVQRPPRYLVGQRGMVRILSHAQIAPSAFPRGLACRVPAPSILIARK